MTFMLKLPEVPEIFQNLLPNFWGDTFDSAIHSFKYWMTSVLWRPGQCKCSIFSTSQGRKHNETLTSDLAAVKCMAERTWRQRVIVACVATGRDGASACSDRACPGLPVLSGLGASRCRGGHGTPVPRRPLCSGLFLSWRDSPCLLEMLGPGTCLLCPTQPMAIYFVATDGNLLPSAEGNALRQNKVDVLSSQAFPWAELECRERGRRYLNTEFSFLGAITRLSQTPRIAFSLAFKFLLPSFLPPSLPPFPSFSFLPFLPFSLFFLSFLSLFLFLSSFLPSFLPSFLSFFLSFLLSFSLSFFQSIFKRDFKSLMLFLGTP